MKSTDPTHELTVGSRVQPLTQNPNSHYAVYDPRLNFNAVDPRDSSGFDFWTTLKIFLRWKWLILAIMLIGTALAVWLTSRITPLYRAVVTLEIQKQEQQIFSQDTGVVSQNIADREFLSTQYVLMRSQSLAERVAAQLALHQNPQYATQGLDEATRLKQAAGHLLKNLNVVPVPGSRVVNLQYISPDNEDAARVANALAENFIASTLERKYSNSAYARDFLQERLDIAKASLEDFERQLADYAKEQEILEIGYGSQPTTLDTNSIVTLNDALAQARTDRIDAEQDYQAILENPILASNVDNSEISNLRARKSELQGEYEELSSIYKPAYPRMIQITERIAQLDSEIITLQGQLEGTVVADAKARFDAARAKEISLEGYVSGLKGNLEDYRDRRIQYTILQREVDTARTQYDGLLQRLKDVTVSSGVGASQVSIVDRANPPGLPFSPNLYLNIIQALIVSTMLGLGLAWLLTFIDDTIKTPEDIKNKLQIPALGVIPKIKGGTNIIVNALKDPKSPISEAFFSTRTSLEFTTGGGSPKSLMITSTQPGEGKTSSITALASAYAKIGRNVLIIDADMRKPSFIADAEKSIGLSGLLTKPSHNLSDSIIKSDIEGLYLLPSGVIPPNPAELLSGARLEALIREAEELFDIVLVDSPPVLSFADAPVLGAICRATMIVIRSGAIRRPAAERTLDRLRENSANILGAILMQFDSKKHGYEYGYYYYAYGDGAYSYGQSKKIDKTAHSQRKIDIFTDENSENM